MLGAAIQSSRGDNTAANVAELKKALAEGKKFQMLSLEDLPDDWTIVSTGDVGGGGAWPYVHFRTEQQKLPEVSIPYGGNVIAARELSKYTGKPIKAIIRNEADGATLEALLLSAEMGVPVVDACMAGRSVPDEQEIIPAAMGSPAAIRFGLAMGGHSNYQQGRGSIPLRGPRARIDGSKRW